MSIVFLLEVGFGFSFNFVSYGCGFFYIEFHKVLEIHMWMRDSLSLEVSPAAGKHPFSSASEFWKLPRCVILRPTWWCSSVKLCEMNLCVARLVFNEFIISISPLIDAV